VLSLVLIAIQHWRLADTWLRRIAYMEMRVLMAKFLYNFQFELAYPDDNWVSTKKAYGAWNNSGLKLRLRAVEE